MPLCVVRKSSFGRCRKVAQPNILKPLLLVLLHSWSVAWAAESTAATAAAAAKGRDAPQRRKLVIGVDGGTESVRACCYDAVTGSMVGKSCACLYPTHHPTPGWAEQDPTVWWECTGQAVSEAVASLSKEQQQQNEMMIQYEFCAMTVDTTCCSVVALDAAMQPLRPCLLWMDQRSAPQTSQILKKCFGDPALAVNCNGDGPVSAEWMTPKALWLAENEPEVWQAATTICEYQDYINYKLTGNLCASSCNAASRWHWDGETCILDATPDDPLPGRPLSLYRKLGIPELANKLPARCLPMGAKVGTLTSAAGKLLGLPTGLPVIQGGPDAFVGMIGLGCIRAGQLCLITGSSHLHCVVTSKATTAPGTWGAYRGAPLPGLYFAEGGQSSTGSILRWARNLVGGTTHDGDDADAILNYKVLDTEADAVTPGADGLIALETFQGSRTPVTDPMARGALMGLTLSHTRGHIWRALMEAVCYGTRACIEGLAAAGHGCEEIVVAGGATRSDVWLQMHADVMGQRVTVCENSDAPLLGCAILASVGVGIHASVPEAVRAMVRTAKHIQPNPATTDKYDEIYKEVYCKVADAARPVALAIYNLRGGDSTSSWCTDHFRGGETSSHGYSDEEHSTSTSSPGYGDSDQEHLEIESLSKPRISPSLLACDWANIEREVCRCMAANLTRFHVDVFDGVFLDSPNALTFGPQMVEAIRRSCDWFSKSSENNVKAFIDLHMCVDRPDRFVETMAAAGGDCFIFQFEATQGTPEAIDLAKKIVEGGMKSGVSINPATNVEDLYPLLETFLVSVVDILAVEPGFGGQEFQTDALFKVRELKKWRDNVNASFDIMVDGGINELTSLQATDAGADVLVAGTFLFKHPNGLDRGAEALTLRQRPC